MKKMGVGGIGCVTLFILPFAAVGTFMSFVFVSDFVNWFRMLSWKEVPAIILSAELEQSRSSKSTTYQTVAEYEYVYGGRTYRSTRVSRYSGSDNIGTFHQDIYNEISRYRDSKKPFRCYVNPDSPEQAILYRKSRLAMLCFYAAFAGAFGGVGYGVLAAMIVELINNRRSSALEKLYPGQPWKARPDWSRGEARTSAGLKMFIAVGVSIFVLTLSIPILIFIPKELMERNFAALLALILPVIAGLLVTWAVRSVLQWRRFGSAVLVLTANPVKPGERLRGLIRIGAELPQSAIVQLQLKCDRSKRVRSGNKTRIEKSTEWSQSSTGAGMTGADGKTCVQVDFEIPEHVPSTGKESENSEIEWELHAKSEIPGIDLNATFKIPVFRIA